jgi:hypothetical protein
MWMAWKESNGAVLAEHGMDVPEGINVNVVENTDNTVHVTLPAAPTANGDLSDEELANAAGGVQCQKGVYPTAPTWFTLQGCIPISYK